MSDREHTISGVHNQKDYEVSLIHASASPTTSSPPPSTIIHPSYEALPRARTSDSDSDWVFIEPDLSLDPTITDSPNPTCPSIAQADRSLNPPSKRHHSESPVSSPQHRPVTSPEIQPIASQLALQRKLDQQDLGFRAYIAREIRTGQLDIADNNSDSDSSDAEEMANDPEAVRKELNENFMFIDSSARHLNHPHNTKFKEKVTKVIKSDRKSIVSEGDKAMFDDYYKTYKLANEATLTFLLVPLMMPQQLTVQDVNEDGQPCGAFKTRNFVEQGVMTTLDRLFTPYCLPHRLLYSSDVPHTMIKKYFDDRPALTTPKPDFAYGLAENKIPRPPPNVVVSEKVRLLLGVAPTAETFFDWENKSGRGVIMISENQALRGVSALILAKRQLQEHIGRDTVPGIDQETYVYAATNDNARLNFYVAYAWVPQDLSHVEFHMDKIGSIEFDINDLEKNPNTLADIRKPLHNIIEWGSITRIPEMNQFYKKLWEVEAEANARDLEKAREEAAKAEEESKPGKKRKGH
ncbi:MAG: hypothetical protein Q9220_007355 [cf. Caloplaca sp. 1 TL-2023]